MGKKRVTCEKCKWCEFNSLNCGCCLRFPPQVFTCEGHLVTDYPMITDESGYFMLACGEYAERVK